MDELISSRASSAPQPVRTPTNRETADGNVPGISPLPQGSVPIGSLVFADELPDGVVVADEAGRIIVFNRVAGRLTRLDPAEVIGKFVFDVLPLRDADDRDWWVYADPYHGLPTRTRHPERSLYLADGTEILVSVGYVRTPRGGRGGLGGTVSPQDRGVPGGRPPGPAQQGRIVPLIADSSRLTFLDDGCADGVIADDRALSVHLAAETMIAEIARVLRPGGRVLACVDSLVLGMAVLADQHHWAHLVDLPHAEVVLVPWPDGTITRCFGPDQARELFSGAGLRVNWIRSRTAFSESVVTHWLRRDPGGLSKLVRAELTARSDEPLGAQLVISASKLRPRTRS